MIAREKKSHYECIGCGQTKKAEEFPVDSRAVTGRKGRCRECYRDADRANYRKRKKLKGIPDRNADKKRVSPAKVLVFDIETAPFRSYTWGLWKQNIAHSQIVSQWFMLTWSAKWLFEDQIHSDKLTPKEAKSEDDARISRSVWNLLNEADIVIAHNANKFDVKRVNTRFVVNGLNPPMPYQVIDTLEHLRKRFAMGSNRLDSVNDQLGLDRKMDTGGFELWDRCMRGGKDALATMEEYNRVDVQMLEETYLRIRPWIKPHPNIGLFIADDVALCPTCGSRDVKIDSKPYATTAHFYDLFRCADCGAVGRSRRPITNSSSSTRSVPK